MLPKIPFEIFLYDSTQMSKIEISTLRSFLLIKQCPGPSSRYGITPCDFYALNYREMATLLTLSEALAGGGFEPLTIGSIRKNLTAES